MPVGGLYRFGYVVHHVEYRLTRLEIDSSLAVVAYAKRLAALHRARVGQQIARHEI